jgi:hypothetical protein
MNISFLFGSGISIPSKISSTEEITKIILSGKDEIKNVDINDTIKSKLYDICNNKNINDILNFLDILFNEIRYYHKVFTSKKINYEDIYYYIKEMHNEQCGEKDNLMAEKFIKYIEKEFSRKYRIKFDDFIKEHIEMNNFLFKIDNYIKSIVKATLDNEITDIKGLDFLVKTNNDEKIENINIFTTNHDLLLESFFEKNKIKVNDGFSVKEYWKPELYNSENSKIKLFKIHGSINWHKESDDWNNNNILKINGNNDSEPIILIGTFNKLEEYTSGIFIDLICLFKKHINTANNLVIAGYSFGDKGINSMITDWAYESRNKRIVIINPKMNDLKDNARGSISNKWDSWIKEGKLKTIEKGIENVTWEEIKNNLISD